MNEIDTEELARKIASAIRSSDTGGSGIDELRRSIDVLSSRLDDLESSGIRPSLDRTAEEPATHASLEKYAVLEAVSPNGSESKACDFEPHGRPCDHCSMCSSRGF